METTGPHILIVDDVLKNLQLTAQILKDEGYAFSLAQDGQSALSVLENQVPDLILLDIMMPGMDGLETCRKIKQNVKLREIPIIFLTAKNETEDLVEGFKAGGVDYVTKPFNRDELLIRVKNHIELSSSRKKILEMNKTRDKLYSIIAHDIRSPLNGIISTLNSIKNKRLDRSDNKFTEIMCYLENSTRHTYKLLDNLLEWTKMQGSSIAIKARETMVKPIITECVQLLSGNANDKNILIEINVPEEDEALFDEITIHTVFRNIISNAIKFTPEQGHIFIESVKSDNLLSIIIRDTGVGIPAEIYHKIFDKNEHYTSLGTNSERGSGLGLYLVKDFVEKNNGEIEVKSEKSQGTTFIVRLPLGQNTGK